MVHTTQQPKVLTVSELTNAIKIQLEGNFTGLLLKGEISNFKLQSSGHLYFSLKDEFSQISCVMFREAVSRIQVPLKTGDQVIVKGELSVYAQRGNYQLIVRELSLVGLGELLMKLELLKQKLHQKGYFEPSRKKPLPRFPKVIGVITSPTGAVIRDILNVLTRRLKRFRLILNPVRVQGDGAAEEIATAIDEMNRYSLADVLIVCRGGGSLEDLMPFNDEKVADALFRSKIPTISAVGHETDISISDFVADLRAPTPSAAAELVSHETEKLLSELLNYRRRIGQCVVKNISRSKSDFSRLYRHPIFSAPTVLLGPSMQRLDDMKELLDQSISRNFILTRQTLMKYQRMIDAMRPERKLKENQMKLEQLKKAIPQAFQRDIQQKKAKLKQLFSHISSINPKSLLKRGYSIIFSEKDGSVITSFKGLSQGDGVTLLVSEGKANATIREIHDT